MPTPSQFNAAWYLANNRDVAAAGVDPYEHFLGSGIAEDRRKATGSTARSSSGTGTFLTRTSFSSSQTISIYISGIF